MKFINKLFINAGLFSVLSLLLLIPVFAVTMSSFNTKIEENAEVLSAQDESINKEKELYNDIPAELEDIIRKVEIEMANQAAESSATNELEIGN
ncbi:hypothetical protein A2380_02955 [candidate division WWE3 bacterium RIFOXYB1_FULL_43_24]|uniref:Uncharacterized protein n=1 Tax=candidate division WWE3 bacterium GW2011_GWF1_42_14 TaxID=1619138 RepID=A0A0G1BJI0_UNCKA|nr:MAG: hypothetical protein UU92_C0007G0025 [candidate division WWE3 bacterium GW2011_GWA1_42_12]KKS33615.1 MAG: hypothetical protein UU97_C0025G0009 [candidate division WWE3 bacterium GW2011_GWD1_42_14]KKS37588.1 MAG: hypothetical protein UV00_C0013G0019 [candidate division WWE3 bacterium GW2011_GWF1_42_14]OGC58716.1 MAG: hypothetical protein A2212_00530 [candidate division WWE3 bacterium RIFOXYA1_FULL_42_9]OGC69055.1 MAG: hypothetical protein A2380_02955 [candidate division WWE3 bacterium RI